MRTPSLVLPDAYPLFVERPDPLRSLRPWLVMLCCAAGLALGWRVRGAYIAGDLWGKAWENGSVGDPWSWVSFIHSPVWNTFMYVVEQWSRGSGTPERMLVYSLAAFSTAAVPALLWIGAGPRVPTALVALGGLLTVLSANTLRPFEEYPLTRPVTLLAVAALLLLDRRREAGDPRVGWAVLAVGAVLFAAEFHLSSWFLLGPMLVGLWIARPRSRRLFAGVALGAVGLFVGTTWPGLYDVLAAGSGRSDWVYQPLSQVLTLEWTNPWLWLPVALYLHPSVAGADRAGAALAAGLGVFTVVHQALFIQGWAIGGPIFVSHHYFELIDPALTLCAIRAMAVAWEQRPGRGTGWALVGLGSLLLWTQAVDYRWGWAVLSARAAAGVE